MIKAIVMRVHLNKEVKTSGNTDSLITTHLTPIGNTSSMYYWHTIVLYVCSIRVIQCQLQDHNITSHTVIVAR